MACEICGDYRTKEALLAGIYPADLCLRHLREFSRYAMHSEAFTALRREKAIYDAKVAAGDTGVSIIQLELLRDAEEVMFQEAEHWLQEEAERWATQHQEEEKPF